MDNIPVEILEMILLSLKGTEVFACRRVCRRWRDDIDSFTEGTWRHFCHSEYLNSEKSKKKSNLIYKELYKSLSLWDRLEEVKGTTRKELSFENESLKLDFKVLSGNKFAVVNYNTPGYYFTCNTIQYFRSTSIEQISEKNISYSFFQYDESDKIILLTEYLNSQDEEDDDETICLEVGLYDTRLHIVLKNDPDMAEYYYDLYDLDFTWSLLSDSEVGFTNSSKIVCIARLIVFEGEETIEYVELASLTSRVLKENIIQFVRTGHNAVNIMTFHATEGISTQCEIYSARVQNFSHECSINSTISNLNILRLLNQYGFHWSDREIYFRVFSVITGSSIIQTHHVVLIETFERCYISQIQEAIDCTMVHIFKGPFYDNDLDKDVRLLQGNGKTMINNCEPNYSLSFGEFSVDKIDVVEILGGHRLFVSIKTNSVRKLKIIDLLHNKAESSAGDGDGR